MTEQEWLSATDEERNAEFEKLETNIHNLTRQLNTQAKHKDSIRDYWLLCAENKKKWVEAIKEYFDSEHTESIQSFEDFKEQFDLD